MAQNDDNADPAPPPKTGDLGPDSEGRVDVDERGRLFTLGAGDGAPLAAVFKTRRARRERRESAATVVEASPPDEEPSYDIVLTDAFRVDDAASKPPPAAATPDDEAAADAAEALAVGEAAHDAAAAEQAAAEQAAAEQAAAEQAAAEQTAAEQAVAERVAVERVAAEKVAAEKVAVEKVAAEKAAAEKVAAEKVAAEKAAAELAAPVLEPQTRGTPPTLPDLVPADADPVWVKEALLGLAADYAKAHRTPTERAWFAEVFRNEYLRANAPRGDASTRVEVDFLMDRLRVVKGARLLDIACGYGRHTLEFARRGHEMVGLDLSLDMLKRALAKAQTEQLSVKFVHGDMRDLNFDQVFDGAFSYDTSFGFFSDMENLNILRSILRALKRGGRFVLDVANRDHLLQSVPNRNWWEGDGCLVQEDIEFDHRQSRLRIKRFLVYADGTQREYDISLRLYSPHELVRALEMVGFELVDLSGSVHTSGAFFGACSPRVLVTARRPV